MIATIYIITILLFILYAGLIIFYRQSWLTIPQYQQVPIGENQLTKISVIIPARNEEPNIGACISSIMAQNYPAHLFEVIVVDDHSTDKTADIILSFKKNVKLIDLKDFTNDDHLNSYKKKAIEIAIQQSTGDLIVTTDADCIAQNTWLQTIAGFYKKYKPAFIAGPVAYHNETGFLKTFQSLDFMTMQGITGAAVYKKFHSMCNGANLAYEKKVFYEVGGFKGIDAIASGDDMLLMHKIYRRYPERVLYLKSVEAIVQTLPMDTFDSFLNQRIRWASKAEKYDDKKIFLVLLMVYLFNCWFFALLIFAFWHLKFAVLLMALLIGKTVIELLFLIPVSKFFSKQKMLWIFPFAQPFHILYVITAGWLGKFGSYKWKERKVV